MLTGVGSNDTVESIRAVARNATVRMNANNKDRADLRNKLETLKAEGWTNSQIADKLGYWPSFIADVISGRRGLSDDMIRRIAERF